MRGSEAQVDPRDAVTGLLNVIDGAGMDDSGRFFDYTGRPMPW